MTADDQDNDMTEVPPLEYASRVQPPRKLVSTFGECMSGLAAWVLGAMVCGALLIMLVQSMPLQFKSGFVTYSIGLLALNFVGLSLYSRRRWQVNGSAAFFGGVLLGLCLTCLLPIGVISILCGPMGRL